MDYISHRQEDFGKIFSTLGIKNSKELFSDIPAPIKEKAKLCLPQGLNEQELIYKFSKIADKNKNALESLSLLGAGFYNHYIPQVVKHIISRSEFYTSYTPYQPEAAQGYLESLYEYQSLICRLFKMEISNCSLYDGAHSLVEGVLLASRLTHKSKIIISKAVSPFYREVLKTYNQNNLLEIIEIPFSNGITVLEEIEKNLSSDVAAVVIQQPNFFGCLEEMAEISSLVHKNNSLFISIVYPISLGTINPPGSYQADIAVAEGQCFGNPLNFGGPGLGIFTTKKEYIRQIPGRIVGRIRDNQDYKYSLVLQTREQHIRREKATSNICSNQALCALAATVYLSFLGGKGLNEVAGQCLQRAHFVAKKICENKDFSLAFSSPFFNEFLIRYNGENKNLYEDFKENKIIFGLPVEKYYPELKNCFLLTVTEKKQQSEELNPWFENIAQTSPSKSEPLIPEKFIYCPQNIPAHSEAEVVKHFTFLSEKNFGIDNTKFYPLGSCTMKYNPKVNEEISWWKEFTQVHPLLPPDLVDGCLEVINGLKESLKEISGMDGISLEPSAGAHGELTALLVLKAYFNYRKEKRTKILVPVSAHGTNPASAKISGFEVVGLEIDKRGNISLESLKKHLDSNLAGIMITNPNTLGLFEENVFQICELVHQAGGQVFYDGANLNALIGVVKPADLGVDIMHFNLHKTFSTPHGGGGPGAGPVGSKKHLVEFLPGINSPKSIGKVKLFFGNFSVLLKAYIYILACGKEGLEKVSEVSVLNANYLKKKLEKNFVIPYERTCMHEFVISGENFGKYGVRTLDFAKRLIDYKIHPPTIYFPGIVKEAMLIEPTETATLEEIDYFVYVMEKILEEAKNNPQILKKAPLSSERIDEVKINQILDVADV